MKTVEKWTKKEIKGLIYFFGVVALLLALMAIFGAKFYEIYGY